MFWCLGASGSVTARHQSQSGSKESPTHIFWPVIMKSSPSLTALVWSDAKSDPVSGSVNSCQQTTSPCIIGFRKRSFCSSVPYTAIDPACNEPAPGIGRSYFDSSSLMIMSWSVDSPPPPYFASHKGNSHPFAPSFLAKSKPHFFISGE